MKLFQYEMRKLLFNKTRLVLLALLLGVYGFLGFILSAEDQVRSTPQEPNAAGIYAELLEKKRRGVSSGNAGRVSKDRGGRTGGIRPGG
jgi:hypothetical protein